MVLTLVQINESYARENTPVLVPIRGDVTQTSGDMCKEKRKHQFKILRPKRNLLQNETFYLLYMSRRLRRSLLEQTANQGAPSSCPGQK